MYINYYIYAIIIVLGVILGHSNSKKNRKVFIILVTAMLMLQGSLRSLSIGSDTRNYYYMFKVVQDMSWQEVWDSFVERYFYRTSDFDIGYTLLQKIITSFTTNWQLFVFIIQLVFFIPLGKLLYKYCKDFYQLVFAFVLYVALFHIIALTGARQLYSIGMTIMAFIYLDENKIKKSLLFIFIGTLIHFSCLLGLLPIILSKLKVKQLKTIHLVSILLVPLVLVSVNTIIILMGSAVGMEKYTKYGMSDVAGGASTFILLLILSSIFCYISIKKKDLLQNKSLANFYIMLPLFTLLGPLIHSNGSMIRISMYFHLYLMLLLPFALDNFFKGSIRRLMYFAVIGALLLLSLRDGGMIYHFFWQEPQFNFFL